MVDVHIPDNVNELSNDVLLQEVQNMAVHEESDALTAEQKQYFEDLRNELLRRMSD